MSASKDHIPLHTEQMQRSLFGEPRRGDGATRDRILYDILVVLQELMAESPSCLPTKEVESQDWTEVGDIAGKELVANLPNKPGSLLSRIIEKFMVDCKATVLDEVITNRTGPEYFAHGGLNRLLFDLQRFRKIYLDICETNNRLHKELHTLEQESNMPAELTVVELRNVAGDTLEAVASRFSDTTREKLAVGLWSVAHMNHTGLVKAVVKHENDFPEHWQAQIKAKREQLAQDFPLRESRVGGG